MASVLQSHAQDGLDPEVQVSELLFRYSAFFTFTSSLVQYSTQVAVAREVVCKGQPAFPRENPKREGQDMQQTALPVFPTGVSKKDWACLSTREISCPLIHGAPVQ